MQSLSRFAGLGQAVAKATSGLKNTAPAFGISGRRFLAAQDGGAKTRDAVKTEDEEFEEFEAEDMLEGKRSGDILRKAFTERSAAALRYEYFTQRAELEAELEAASAFRALTETAKQQALGFLELLEEYGTHADEAGAVHVGTTLDNIAAAALVERNDVDRYLKHAEQASEDAVDQLAEWYSDMSDASGRTADRLDLVSSLMDAQYEEMDEEGDGVQGDIPDGPTSTGQK